MNQTKISNLFSEHRLKDSTLEFLESTKFLKHHLDTPEKFELISYVNNNPETIKKIFNSYYETGFCETISLVSSNNITEKQNNFLKINQERKSTRKFSEIPVSFNILSDFLKSFYSITGNEEFTFKNEVVNRKIRNIASGGSLYPTEIFIINNKIKELPTGAFRYNVHNSELELIKNFNIGENKKLFYEAMMKTENNKVTMDMENTSFFIIFSSVINKHSFKYQDFGVVLSLIEIGEFIHSAYLTSSALDIGCCAYGGFLNNKMSELLELSNPLHLPLICMAVGNK
jgi:SagB-type dehydrogenase family enzyme